MRKININIGSKIKIVITVQNHIVKYVYSPLGLPCKKIERVEEQRFVMHRKSHGCIGVCSRVTSTERGLAPLYGSFAESTDLSTIDAVVLTWMRQTSKDDLRPLLRSMIDSCVVLPQDMHGRLISLVTLTRGEVSHISVLKSCSNAVFSI